MKYRLIKLGTIFMSSMTLAAGSGVTAAHGATVQAGINAALSDYLDHTEGAETVLGKAQAQETKAAGSEDSEKEKEKKEEKNEEKKEEKKETKKKTAEKTETKKKSAGKTEKNNQEKEQSICGFTNLGIANVDNFLNVRENAGEDAKVVGRLPADAGCEITGTENGWHHITSGNVSGYVKSDYIVTGSQAEKMAEKLKRKVAVINSMTVYVREKPNTDCTILTVASEDDEYEVLKEGKKWIKVKLDDENGYVNAKYADISEELKKAVVYTEPEETENEDTSSGDASGDGGTSGTGTSSTGSSVAQTALKYVGYPYVWGGTSLTGGVDCSGFTMQIMAMYGVYLPHLASAQAGYGRSVSTSELQAGDLIFYGSASDISHVAIYIGNGQIVHASNSRDGIKVSSAYYMTPVCCRRMF